MLNESKIDVCLYEESYIEEDIKPVKFTEDEKNRYVL